MTAPGAGAVIEAARLHAPGDIRVGFEPPAAPGPGEVMLDVTSVGLCGSDLHWFDEGEIGDARLTRPLILGHEFAAVVSSGPRSGERVAVDPAISCGQCPECRTGRSNQCPAVRFAGHGEQDGALRTSMAWPARLLHPIPDSVGDEAALLEPLGVALHALDLGAPADGARVGVYGCGPIGLLLVQLLASAGPACLIATDRRAHRVAAASAMGATEAGVDPGPDARHDDLDVVFEVAGTDAALADAMAAVRPGGRVVVVGIPADDRTTFPAAMARRKELTLLMCRRMLPGDLPRAIELAATGRIALGPLVTDRYPLDQAPQAFRKAASRDGLKVLVLPSAGAAASAR